MLLFGVDEMLGQDGLPSESQQASVDECASTNKLVCSLLKAPRGSSAIISGILAEPDTEARLLRLGFAPGRTITVLTTGARCLVLLAGATVALDSLLAAQVSISLLP